MYNGLTETDMVRFKCTRQTRRVPVVYTTIITVDCFKNPREYDRSVLHR